MRIQSALVVEDQLVFAESVRKTLSEHMAVPAVRVVETGMSCML